MDTLINKLRNIINYWYVILGIALFLSGYNLVFPVFKPISFFVLLHSFTAYLIISILMIMIYIKRNFMIFGWIAAIATQIILGSLFFYSTYSFNIQAAHNIFSWIIASVVLIKIYSDIIAIYKRR